MAYIVEISHLDDDELSFFGWEKIGEDDEFDFYWNSRYNETTTVTKSAPKYLVVDDINDAAAMTRGDKNAKIIGAPPSRRTR